MTIIFIISTNMVVSLGTESAELLTAAILHM